MARGISKKSRTSLSGRLNLFKRRKSGNSQTIDTPPSSAEGSPQPETSLRSSESESGFENRNQTTPTTDHSPSRSASTDRELTPNSIMSAEFESGAEDEMFHPTPAEATAGEGSEVRQETSTSAESPMENGGLAVPPEEGAHLRGRQTSIVHASNLTSGDHVAAARARATSKIKSKHLPRDRLGTDELTNQGMYVCTYVCMYVRIYVCADVCPLWVWLVGVALYLTNSLLTLSILHSLSPSFTYSLPPSLPHSPSFTHSLTPSFPPSLSPPPSFPPSLSPPPSFPPPHSLPPSHPPSHPLTEAGGETVEVSIASPDTLNRHSQINTEPIRSPPSTPTHTAKLKTTPSSGEQATAKKIGSGVSRGSRRKSRRNAKSLASSPALRFITRKDLYSFLNSAGVSG